MVTKRLATKPKRKSSSQAAFWQFALVKSCVASSTKFRQNDDIPVAMKNSIDIVKLRRESGHEYIFVI